MSTTSNINDAIGNADAIIAQTQDAFVSAESTVPVSEPSAAELRAEIARLRAEAETARLAAEIATLKAATAKPAADPDPAKGKGKPKPAATNPAADNPVARAAERLAKALATAKELGQVMLSTDISLGVIDPKHHTAADKLFLAMLAAEVATLKAASAKPAADPVAAKGKSKPKPAATNPAADNPVARAAERLAKALATAKELGQVMLSTDISLGVIDPKHHTAADKLFLAMLAKERTKGEKLADAANIPGTYQAAVFHYFNQLGYSQDWTNAFLKGLLSRNVVSKMYIRTAQGNKVLWFDTAWRPNLKGMEYERMTDAEKAAAQAVYGK